MFIPRIVVLLEMVQNGRPFLLFLPLFLHIPFLFSLFIFLSETLVHIGVSTHGILVLTYMYRSNQITEIGPVAKITIPGLYY